MNDQAGLFELATDGILFMDEISEMDIRLQPKLLRVLESKEVMTIGAKKLTHVNTRVIAATNRNLKKFIEEGRFRNDLYHRLSIFEINIPPLRERKEDIPVLFDFFVKKLAQKYNRRDISYDPGIIEHMSMYDFPGNVRELRNIIERAIIVATDNELIINDFDQYGSVADLVHKRSGKLLSANPDNLNLEQNELTLIVMALTASKQNKVKAAGMLGITQQALRRKMQKHELLGA